MHWTKQEIALPKLPDGYEFKLLYDTYEDEDGKAKSSDDKKNTMFERSVRIFVSYKDPNFKPKKEVKRKKK